MKRMIDNKTFEELMANIEKHSTPYITTNVVLDEDNKVLGSQVKDVENDITYNLPLGIQVEANPTLEGTESDLEGIEIDGTKFKVGGGKKLYKHCIAIKTSSNDEDGLFTLSVINDNTNPISNISLLATYLWNNGFKYYDDDTKFYEASGFKLGTSNLICNGISASSQSACVIGCINITSNVKLTPKDLTTLYSSYSMTDTIIAL